ncbi:malonic semialdehyde reductase [Hyphomonas johnsonii]|jgi:3-hydroxypropanoate dehydrogenase|uniref:Putative NADH dehydrogenase/NAD(P)H nitroreductase HJO_13076 n=1 Tax=Hyphomonas johnsonii MHS-2 TaxID=1280950 RepID=A0A059FJE0_9PROT|nr:malonic semialdehyde reductase [Hyphomonas johnsonii]KCZ90785.1 malonic semialdehyde reductase [Hyphomonas johnsonii MHS-2]
MAHPVNDHALDVIFRDARTQNGFTDKAVPEILVRAVYDLAKMGPTSANCSPARFVWVTTEDGKKRLAPHMSGTNVDKTMAAPWTCIIAYDLHFKEKIPKLFPHAPGAKDWFDKNRDETAFRNGSLQGAYLMIAARALGLDCGPMSGFDPAGVNKEFFESQDGEMQNWRVNFICNIGHGDKSKLFDRSPRLDFDEACRIV